MSAWCALVDMKRTSEADRQKIVALYISGWTRSAISTEVGCSVATVSNIVREAGVVGVSRKTGVRTPSVVEAQVATLYRQGVSWAEIMHETGVTEHTVSAIIKRNNESLNRKQEVDNQGQIVDLYLGGKTGPEIADSIGCAFSTVYKILEKSGIKTRERIACHNPHYFDIIDQSNKAYWLGFIAADGCVTGFKTGGPRLQVKLARKDRAHLELLHRELDACHPVRDSDQVSYGEVRPYSTLTVYSPQLVTALNKHGIVERKTFDLQPWDGPEDLVSHYWRGVIDGDGSITINDNGVYVQLAGSVNVVHAFAQWANMVCKTRATPAKRGNCYVIQVGGTRRVLDLLKALYGDAPTALKRKKDLADLALQQYR